jgi:AAA domain
MHKPLKDWNAAYVEGINAREVADSIRPRPFPKPEEAEDSQNSHFTEPKRAARTNNVPSSRSWNEGLITAEALQSKEFKPVRIILPDLIAEGTTILAGKPKVGKSWLALDVCMAVADETRFVLGDKRPIHGDALYLALEDNQRRLKKRIDKIAQGQARWSNRLAMHTEWKRVDQGGLEDIEAWCKSVKEPRLIWIDTLAKIRPIGGRNEQAYAADYRAIEGLQKLSGQYQVGIVVNHHLRKMASDDAFDEVSGTLGLNGAADTIIVMKRHSGMMKIHVQGRDIESAEFAADFNRNTCRWRIVGDADEVFRSQERRAIIAVLKDAAPEKMSIGDIMSATDRRDRDATKSLLHKMRSAGEVVSEKGRYSLASQETPQNAVDRVDRRGFDDQPPQQANDDSGISDSENGKRKSKRVVNGDASVDRALTATDSHKSVADNADLDDGQRVNAVNGSFRSDPGPIPDCLLRAPKVARPPALGPLADSLDDLQ